MGVTPRRQGSYLALAPKDCQAPLDWLQGVGRNWCSHGDEPASLGEPCGQPLPYALTMTSSTPTSKSEQQLPAMAVPVGQPSWWRRWLEPILVVTIIVALFTAVVTGGVAMFQSVKGDLHSVKGDINSVKVDIRAVETRVGERIDRVSERIDRVSERIEASEARQTKRIDEVRAEVKEVRTEVKEVRAEVKEVRAELKQDNAEIKADMKAMDNKLDRVLEAVLAAKV